MWFLTCGLQISVQALNYFRNCQNSSVKKVDATLVYLSAAVKDTSLLCQNLQIWGTKKPLSSSTSHSLSFYPKRIFKASFTLQQVRAEPSQKSKRLERGSAKGARKFHLFIMESQNILSWRGTQGSLSPNPELWNRFPNSRKYL